MQNESNDSSVVNDLEGRLHEAVEQVCSSDAPHDRIERCLDRVMDVLPPETQSDDIHEKPRSKVVPDLTKEVDSRMKKTKTQVTVLRMLAASGLAAALLFGVMAVMSPHSIALADIRVALNKKPWVHGTVRALDGSGGEVWMSLPRGITAQRTGGNVLLEDSKRGVRYQYDPKTNELFLLPLPNALGESNAFTLWFRTLFDDRGAGTSQSPSVEIVTERTQTVQEGARSRIECDLTMRVSQSNDLQSSVLIDVQLRIDPRTHLPSSMKLKSVDSVRRRGLPPGGIEFVFDYSDDGPADVYALGVPQTAELVDRVPRDDVGRILKTMNTNRDSFDSYFAIVTYSKYNGNRLARSEDCRILVWRSGNRIRVESLRPGRRPKQFQPDGSGIVISCDRQLRYYSRSPRLLSDGKTIFQPDRTGDDGTTTWQAKKEILPGDSLSASHLNSVSGHFPEFQAFPHLEPSKRGKLDLNSQPELGPANTILLRFQPNSKLSVVADQMQFWLDPELGYAARRSETTFPSHKESVYEMEQFEKTPQGIWYPTLIRRKHCVDLDQDGSFRGDRVFRFYLNFTAEFPENLFDPNNNSGPVYSEPVPLEKVDD